MYNFARDLARELATIEAVQTPHEHRDMQITFANEAMEQEWRKLDNLNKQEYHEDRNKQQNETKPRQTQKETTKNNLRPLFNRLRPTTNRPMQSTNYN